MASCDAVVLVVDDDVSVREGVEALLRAAGVRCETFDSGTALLRTRLPDAPACLVLDVHLPGSNGLEVTAELRRRGDALPVIFITGRGTIPMSVQAIKLGAVEFLEKPFGEEELLRAIEQALTQDQAARSARAERQVLHALFERLTARERDVLAHVMEGRMNKEIARELGTAIQTVKQQRGRVMQKLGVRSVAELVQLVQRHRTESAS